MALLLQPSHLNYLYPNYHLKTQWLPRIFFWANIKTIVVKFKLFILTCTFVRIRYHSTLEFVRGPNLRRKFPDFGIQAPESSNISCWILATVAGIQPAGVGIWLFAPDSNHHSWILTILAKIRPFAPDSNDDARLWQ
jgi:hypothetical protein